MRIILLLFFMFIVNKSFSQISGIEKQKWHWNSDLKQDTTAGYTQVIKIDNVLYISGVVTNDLTPKGIAAVYNGLKSSLTSYGATFENVVKENLYTTDIETMKNNNYIRKAFYNGDFPAATWVQVERLYMPESKLEVELIAHLPK